MVRPTSVDRPEGVELDEMRDGEDDGMLHEYVRFAATDWDAGEAFAERLRAELNDDWQVSVGGQEDTMMIELFRELNSVEGPPLESPEMQEYLEEEAEYYKEQFEAEQERRNN